MDSPRSRRPDSIKAYTKLGLRLYDPLIVKMVAPHVWGCSPDILVDHYREHVTSNHADIGVGTGYFLDRCGFDSTHPRLALIDVHHRAARQSRHADLRLHPGLRRRPGSHSCNGLRVIDNRNDRCVDLRRQLQARFVDCRVELVGCMALFSATVPRNH